MGVKLKKGRCVVGVRFVDRKHGGGSMRVKIGQTVTVEPGKDVRGKEGIEMK